MTRLEINQRLDEIMDELDSLSHVSEREQYESLVGEYKDLEKELLTLMLEEIKSKDGEVNDKP